MQSVVDMLVYTVRDFGISVLNINHGQKDPPALPGGILLSFADFDAAVAAAVGAFFIPGVPACLFSTNFNYYLLLRRHTHHPQPHNSEQNHSFVLLQF